MRKPTTNNADIPTSNEPTNNDDVNTSNDEPISNDETILNVFRHAVRKKYILPLAECVICNINTHQCDNVDELSFYESVYRVAKMHNQHTYIRKIQETVIYIYLIHCMIMI